MTQEHPNWSEIVPLAQKLGAGKWSIFKWKQRGAVPAKWALALMQESGGKLTLSDFSRSPAPDQSERGQ